MKQTIMSLMLVGFVLLATCAGTYAVFSDSETTDGNGFVAGTFALNDTGSSLPLQINNIKPGWNIINYNDEEDRAIGGTDHGVTNTGDVSGEVYIIARNFEEPTGGYLEYSEKGGLEVGPKDFADVIHIKVYVDNNTKNILNEAERSVFRSGELVYDGSLRDLSTPSFSIDPGEFVNCYFVAYMPMDLNDEDDTYEDTIGDIPAIDGNEDDNAYQADGVRCEIVFVGSTTISS